jgi:hypothetical protein
MNALAPALSGSPFGGLLFPRLLRVAAALLLAATAILLAG